LSAATWMRFCVSVPVLSLLARDRHRPGHPTVDGEEVAVVGTRYRVAECVLFGWDLLRGEAVVCTYVISAGHSVLMSHCIARTAAARCWMRASVIAVWLSAAA
jgi:hypothetical protein